LKLWLAPVMEKCFILNRCSIPIESTMAKCPKCKKEVSKPKKTWKMAGRKDKSGKRTELTIGLFECCGKSFRSVMNKRKI
jgi:hypothetical protein